MIQWRLKHGLPTGIIKEYMYVIFIPKANELSILFREEEELQVNWNMG